MDMKFIFRNIVNWTNFTFALMKSSVSIDLIAGSWSDIEGALTPFISVRSVYQHHQHHVETH